jgi:putative endonuclease
MYYVYILASINRVLYIGSSDDPRRRVDEHKRGQGNAFTARYRVNKLVYYEEAESRGAAIRREMAMKRWTRARKIALIESVNPQWIEAEGVLVPPSPQIPR